ncbi:hypothetical protein SAMN02745885_00943 [Carboxydocella sporoproducens DSM 16521]|uniref:Uncharacterized protein n=2 Tax=Carboxydocella TaxID=178898 RepID=A0A1T4NK37_9FIRM|nr:MULTISPECIES: DUF6230 family protein [Carboxydocella]AVX20079.1 hypothetical protein CFE_0881 [Carboxydocella thermautotrophica]GAW27845.1 hypothetical protein ULO1_04150 [Carboxydocella sp. ULO1]SJZ79619.1 hypothetical protein SAMN02745885_00943 [Carboxydocella sporoproducens DSM 16521]
MLSVLNLNKKLFFWSLGLTLGSLFSVLVTLANTGNLFAAMPLAGVGGFVIEADKITGTNFELIPSVADTNLSNKEQESWTAFPQSQTTMDTVSIWGLRLYKNIDLSHLGFPVANYVQVLVEANTTESKYVSGTQLLMNADYIEAEQIDFGDLQMDENMRTDHPNLVTGDDQKADIGMKASSVTLTRAKINAHYMSTKTMSIPGMKLTLHLYDSNNREVAPANIMHSSPWNN